MTASPHGSATITVTVNRARHALLTAVSWADPAGLGLPLALAQSQADLAERTVPAEDTRRSGHTTQAEGTGRTAARAPEVRAPAPAPARSEGRAARRRRSAVRG
ncbi:hypothetical protein [Streptomyces sp. NBC_00859]|uniref:hypothetical protein n=1 Tax=Streptomyces sp. NBC_00859 TaxID=2903682 RepID=UPI003863F2E3|nr:hypothetical protein OG584_18725 [Streptomyces sp. NBC_00859]